AHGAAADALHNDFTVTAPGMLMPGTYFARVSSASSDVFGVGSYHLTIGASATATSTAIVSQLTGVHNTFDTAAVLSQTVNSVNHQLDYTAQVTPNGVDNTTYLQVQAPGSTLTDPMNLVVSIQDVGALADGQVAVFDANHNQLSARTLTDCT